MTERRPTTHVNDIITELEKRVATQAIVALTGQESTKIVDGKRQKVIPFVGADRNGQFSKMGFGISLPDDKSGKFWGLMPVHRVIQSWRAMKILEQLPEIKPEILGAAWNAGTRHIQEDDEKQLQELASMIGKKKLRKLRRTILNQAPSVQKLQTMLSVFRDHNVKVDGRELNEEIEAKRITLTPLIAEIIKEDEAERLRTEETADINSVSRRPPSKNIFSRLFRRN